MPETPLQQAQTSAAQHKKQPKKIWEKFLQPHVPISEKIFFVQHLGVMLKAGVSLSRALHTLEAQTTHTSFKKVLRSVAAAVESGVPLSDALVPYHSVFSEILINMLKAGEAGGKLEEVLNQLYIQMKKDHEIVSKVRGAMIYPSVIVCAMLGIGVFMFIFVIPNLVSIFEGFDAQLPLPTRVLIFVSNSIQHYGLYILLGTLLLIASSIQVLRTEPGKNIVHKVLLKTPILKGIIKKINLARFSRTFSSLLKTDISITRTFEITARVVSNRPYRLAISQATAQIKKGISIAEVLKANPTLFPPLITQMVAVGEETGELDTILEELAQFYEEEVNQLMNDLPAIIEPVLILILGSAIGGVAVAIMLPMYTLTQSI